MACKGEQLERKKRMNIARELRRLHIEFLYSRMAYALSGKKAILEWRDLDGYRGLTFKRGDDVIIQVRNGLDEDQEFRTILHEISHVKLHESGLADESALAFLPESTSDDYPDWYLENRWQAHEKREREASHQVDQWLALSGDGSIKDRILKLLEWRE
jgi:hypothetical protein